MIKPARTARVQWGHPLARGFVYAFPINEGGDSSTFTILRDVSNFTRDFSWFGTPNGGWVGGPNGAAYNFSSNGQVRSLAPVYPWVGNPTPCTVACGIKFNSDSATGAVLAYGNSGPGIMLQRFSGLMYWEVNGTTNRVGDVAGFTVNTWMHVAGTYDGNILRLYKNAVQQAQSTRGAIQITQGDSKFYINDNTLAGADDFVLDYLYVYNRSLSVDELGMLMADPFQMFRARVLLPVPQVLSDTIGMFYPDMSLTQGYVRRVVGD